MKTTCWNTLFTDSDLYEIIENVFIFEINLLCHAYEK